MRRYSIKEGGNPTRSQKIYKHGTRMRLYQLEKLSTVDPGVKEECIMLNGDCMCFEIKDCKYFKPELT